jgi:N-acetylglutamate synthase-like GNAT family acetyltransferase
MLKIRQGKPEDAAALTDLAFRSKAHWGYDQKFMEACREELTYRPSDFPLLYFGVLEDPMILGFYALDIHTKDKVEMTALFVEPKYIDKGYGKALMNHAKIQAKVFGAKEIVVQSDPYAEAFYLAMGAVKIGEKESESIAERMLPLLKFKL